MRYFIHQGSFDFPWPFTDQSTNSLIITDPDSKETLNVTISRDRLEPGENLEENIKRQQRLIAKQVPGYAELSRKKFTLENSGLEVLQMEAQSKQGGFTLCQLQSVIMLPGGAEMLIAYLGIPGTITGAHRKLWADFLNSFALPEEKR